MLKQSSMVESTSGATGLTLQAQTGESLLVRDIHSVVAAAGAEDYDVSIDRKRIQSFTAPSSWHLLSNMYPTGYHSIVNVLRRLGLLQPIPIAEGETLTITAPGASDFLDVLYDVYDAQDIKAGMYNGSKAQAYDLFQVISNAGVRATAGDLQLNQSDLDSVFPAFPGGDVVPARHRMILKALFGAAVTKGKGVANGEYTTKLKLLSDREDILDKDLLGIDFLGDVAHTAATTVYGSVVSRISTNVAFVDPRVFVFDKPPVFEPGSELNVFTTLARTGAGADFVAGEIKLGMLFEVQML